MSYCELSTVRLQNNCFQKNYLWYFDKISHWKSFQLEKILLFLLLFQQIYLQYSESQNNLHTLQLNFEFDWIIAL